MTHMMTNEILDIEAHLLRAAGTYSNVEPFTELEVQKCYKLTPLKLMNELRPT